jgi:hypothetical protein
MTDFEDQIAQLLELPIFSFYERLKIQPPPVKEVLLERLAKRLAGR